MRTTITQDAELALFSADKCSTYNERCEISLS